MRADCRVTERIGRGRWTGGTAQGYRTCMFKPTLLIPLFFILSAGCKDDEPTAKFGEPCGRDESELECADDLQCQGYCAPRCEQDSDCPTIEGYRHVCSSDIEQMGVCFIFCEETSLSCPQDLGTPMKCGVGTCEREDGS